MKWLFGTILGVVAALVILFWFAGYNQVSGPYEEAAVTPEQRAQAESYVARSLLPLPDGWTFETFEPESGVALRAGRIEASDPKGTVVLVPGYTAVIEVYARTIRSLHEAGYTVAALEQRGQGMSHRVLAEPDKGHVESYDDLADDLAAFVRTLPGPVLVYGNSMGGHIAMRMLGRADAPEVAGTFLLVPMVKINTGPFPYEVARNITRLHSLMGFDGERAVGQSSWSPDANLYSEAGPCNSVPERAWTLEALYVLRPELRVRGTTNGWVHRTMASTDEITQPQFLAGIDHPVMMVTAGIDNYVDTAAAARACTAMGQCRREHYETSLHCIANETTEVRDDIFAKTIRFFDEVTAAAR